MLICECGEIINGCTFKDFIKTSANPSTPTIGHENCGYIFDYGLNQSISSSNLWTFPSKLSGGLFLGQMYGWNYRLKKCGPASRFVKYKKP